MRPWKNRLLKFFSGLEEKNDSSIFCIDYSPFGLTYHSWKRSTGKDNKLNTFQDQELITDLNLNWVQFKWRNHDPSIGRFFNIDPLAEDYYYSSTYAFSENDVISAIELEGLEKLRITNYSRIQSNKIRNNTKLKNKVLNTPVTATNNRSDKIQEIERSNKEIMRVISFGSNEGFPDDFMVNRLKDNGIEVPEAVENGEKTTIVEIIDAKAELSVELKGISENKNGELKMISIGKVNPSKEKSKINVETGKAVVLKTLENVIDFFIMKKVPVEIPLPITVLEEVQ